MVLPDFGELGLLDDAPADVQLRRLRVEIRLRHADRERRVDPCGGGGSRTGFCGDAPHGGGP